VLKNAVEILGDEPSLELGLQYCRAVGQQVKAGSHCCKEEGTEPSSFSAPTEI